MLLRQIFYLNQQGKRKNIEDSLYPLPGEAQKNGRVFLVCDGVGGENKGEEASRIACDVTGRMLSGIDGAFTQAQITNAVSTAVQEMHNYAVRHSDAENMSTTLTLACLQSNGIWAGWCGDSRIYHIRNGRVLWRTKDHSLVQQLVDAGEITEDEALHHPRKNIILRSLSASSPRADIDTHFIDNARQGDYFLLCTDGLLEQIGDRQLQLILSDDVSNQDKASMFLQYCEGNTSDNFSMYLLQLGVIQSSGRKAGNKAGKILLFAVVIILAAATYFLVTGSVNKEKKPGKPAITKPAADKPMQRKSNDENNKQMSK